MKINNALQYRAVDTDDAKAAAQSVLHAEMERLKFGSDAGFDLHLITPWGNMDTSVVAACLGSLGYRVRFVETFGECMRLSSSASCIRKAFVCNSKDHYVALTFHRFRWYLHDSMDARPRRIAHRDMVWTFLRSLSVGAREAMGRRVMYFEPL